MSTADCLNGLLRGRRDAAVRLARAADHGWTADVKALAETAPIDGRALRRVRESRHLERHELAIWEPSETP